MRQTIADTFEQNKLASGLSAGAATVGRPTGVDGKKMYPRRARVTTKEKEKLSAGGPGSGRKPGRGNVVSYHPEYQSMVDHAKSKGYAVTGFSRNIATFEHDTKPMLQIGTKLANYSVGGKTGTGLSSLKKHLK